MELILPFKMFLENVTYTNQTMNFLQSPLFRETFLVPQRSDFAECYERGGKRDFVDTVGYSPTSIFHNTTT